MLDSIPTIRKDGKEKFLKGGDSTLLDYWAWGHSDVMGNAERGILAEYIVSMALDVHKSTRTEWDSYDVLSKDGIKIEVKSSGYLQTWVQKTYSALNFGINPTQAWNKDDNTYEQVKRRQADIYVFCVHNHKEQETANPLDLDQWNFYVLSTKMLDKKVPNQKSINLAGILKLDAIKTDYSGLNQTIHKVFNNRK